MKKLILIAFLALPLAAQQRFTVSTGVVVLNPGAQAVTIQQPAASATATPSTLQLETAVVMCTVTCVITQTQNSVAPTTTAGTIVAISPVGLPSNALVFTASNFSGGTVVPPVITMTGGGTTVIDLSKVIIPKGAGNYTVSIASITGSANITLTWKESSQ